MGDQPPYTTAEIDAAARNLREMFGDDPIQLGQNGWRRLIQLALGEIGAERSRRQIPAPAGGEEGPGA